MATTTQATNRKARGSTAALCPRCERMLLRDGDEDLCIACGFRRERLSSVATFVLAGGRGTRLGVLSRPRAKPALPFGGAGSLIDFTLQNCERTGLSSAFVLGQYRWRTVQRALRASRTTSQGTTRLTLRVSPSAKGTGGAVYRGTADAVRQNLDVVGPKVQNVLVLAGDHVYDMDYRPFIAVHRASGAQITMAVAPAEGGESHRFGMARLGSDDFVTEFEEKPEQSSAAFASMGIYVFDVSVLRNLLDASPEGAPHDDFGHDVLPAALAQGSGVAGYVFEDYWRDVGSAESYWSSSIERLASDADPYPGREVVRSVIAPGATIERGAIVHDSVVLAGARIKRGAEVRGAIVDEDSVIGRRAHVGLAATDGERTRPSIVGRRAVVDDDEYIGAGAAVAHDGRRSVVDL
ncbi:MAG: sugar phosphate nucleotidyltransferase [Dehalococcoidia bacterium]